MSLLKRRFAAWGSTYLVLMVLLPSVLAHGHAHHVHAHQGHAVPSKPIRHIAPHHTDPAAQETRQTARQMLSSDAAAKVQVRISPLSGSRRGAYSSKHVKPAAEA